MNSHWLVWLILVQLIGISIGDIYMHNPRGSNNRNCERNVNRNNDNRLFDSQNNAKGGYACPRAVPFACYKDADPTTCNDKNTENPIAKMVDADGNVVELDGAGNTVNPQTTTNTERFYYTVGSVLPLEWTNQHGSGRNSKVHSDIVIQVACENTLTDDCGDGSGTCGPRDGTPVNNSNNTLNGAATQTINFNNNNPDSTQKDGRYGRHESFRYYQKCFHRERNKRLYTADQNLNSNAAIVTRQNPNRNNRYGLECSEEAAYYPYWHDSPWIDVAVLTSNSSQCRFYQSESQNVKSRWECICETCTGEGTLPNNKNDCLAEAGATWVEVPSHRAKVDGSILPPECREAMFSRDNHLGNVYGTGYTYQYNWTIPEWMANQQSCTLRIRYNISTSDFDDVTKYGTSQLNDEDSPLKDRDNSERESYRYLANLINDDDNRRTLMGFAVNTNQYGRVFQDRSYMFKVKPRPSKADCANVYNLNVRGKRGNIVQTYPAVEYDFVPNVLTVTEDDCVHVQWTGSDYNPNRNPNDAEGGPRDPSNRNANRADRSNLVQMSLERENHPILDASQFTMFKGDPEVYKSLAFINQGIEDPDKCMTISELLAEANNNEELNNRNRRETYHKNCMKLSGAETPYFDLGLAVPGPPGRYAFMSTRNNNFSNRGQKGFLHVSEGSGLSVGGKIAISIATMIGLAGAGFLAFTYRGKISAALPSLAMKKGANYQNANAGTPHQTNANVNEPRLSVANGGVGVGGAAAAASSSSRPHGHRMVATNAYKATEAGELSFSVGEVITVLNQDPSGWWEGRLSNGKMGLFPSNFCTEVQTSAINKV